jgi:CRISPR-associated protein Cmr5
VSGPTLEQRRAADAWKKAQGRNADYRNLAKGLPALVMNSGLLQVIAFLHEKGGKQGHCRELGDDLRAWLKQRFTEIPSSEFKPFMESVMKATPSLYQRVSAEAMAWLRWSRQMASAVIDKD